MNENRRNINYKNIPNNPATKQIVFVGLVILVGFFGGFLLWSAVSPLESAAVAQGHVIVESSRKTIQHLEGGIIKKIFVTEGALVKKGDELIQLDQTQTEANLQILRGQTNLLLARKAWLEALRDEKSEVTFPDRLAKQTDPQIIQIMESANSLFKSKRSDFIDSVNILKYRVQQLNSEIDSLRAQAESSDRQLQLVEEEKNAVLYLEKQGYIDKPKLLALEREEAKLQGEKGEKLGLMAQAGQKISETELQMVSLKDTLKNDVLKQLENTELDLVSNLEKEVTAEDILKRSLIVAPQAGRVLNLREHTIGGVIGPREPLMDIVPDTDKLIIEARLQPHDIEAVHPGLPARVRLIALKQRKTPTLDGKVTLVSADIEHDEKTNEPYYTIRVEVDAKELADLKDVTLYPGMPVQVNVIIEKRTPLQYFITPITDSFTRAFREQ